MKIVNGLLAASTTIHELTPNSHEINGEFKFEVQQLERQRREL
jgi:hypothetical protein